MNKRVLYALILIGLTVVVLLFNVRSSATVRLPFGLDPSMPAAFAYLMFSGVGVAIGSLLK
jgi:hypothetical protein